MNRVLVGFVWRQIPVLSQFKLENEYGPEDEFVPWAQRILKDYERRCANAAEECSRSVELLTLHGCHRVVVCPDAIGSVRLVLFDRLLDELPKESFLMVSSWGDFGSESTVLDCVDRALAQKVYVITEQHLSLQYLPADRLDEAYRSMVRPQIYGGYRVRRSRTEQITELLEQGLTPVEIQEQLKVSKSTYYRLMAEANLVEAINREHEENLNRRQ
jgi:DNA-binding CsgD family transcriptional regulator